jgi:3-hydroxyisobutyrate dehydrogenase
MIIGIIGLGSMGGGMAGTLLAAGFTVIGCDPALADSALTDANFTRSDTPAELVGRCEAIILSLPTAAIVEQVIAGEGGLAATARPGLTIIDTTTSHPDTSRRMAALLAEKGAAFIDAPVSGGPAAAASGTMGMVLGGSEDAIAAVAPVLDALTRIRTHCGPVGAGHAVKIINNALCGANLLLGAEAVRLGAAYGIDPQNVINGVNSGSGRSGVTEVNFPRWILSDEFDSGFTMKLMRKDIRLAQQLVAEGGLSLAIIGATAQQWAASEPAIPDDADFNRIADFVLKD